MSRLDELITELCPDGVKQFKFSELCDYIRGVTYNKSQEAQSGDTGCWKILRANNISLLRNTLNFDDVKLIKKEVRIKPSQFLKQGDILICAGSGSKEHVGKVAYIFNDMDYSFGGFMAVIRCSNELDSRYLFHVLTGGTFKNYLSFALNSTTINNLNASVMAGFTFPVPPLPVQREIVRILDNFTELTARQKQYEYYHNHVLCFDASTPLLPLNDVIISLNTGLNPRQFFKLNTDDAKNYYITIREIHNGIITPSQKTDRMNDEALRLCNNRSNLEAGDVLFSGTGTIGETAIIKQTPTNWNIKEGVYTIKPNQEKISPSFLRYILMSKKTRDTYMKKVAGGTVKSIPMAELRKVKIPVPSMEEQRKIVALLDRFDALCNDITNGLPAEIAARQKQYEYYRDKLLSFKKIS